jgi:hypothetical protein
MPFVELSPKADYVTRRYRHWSPLSEKYTGGDALLTAMDRGWRVQSRIQCQEHWHGDSRRICIYSVELNRGDETLNMAIIDNPFVTRLIDDLNLQIVSQV